MSWRRSALCATLETAEVERLFFSDDPAGIVQGKAMCARCLVWSECREEHDRVEPDARSAIAGIVAGEWPAERIARRRAARAEANA